MIFKSIDSYGLGPNDEFLRLEYLLKFDQIVALENKSEGSYVQ